MYKYILVTFFFMLLHSSIRADDTCMTSNFGELQLSEYQKIVETSSELSNYTGCYKALLSLLPNSNPLIWKNDDHVIIQTENFTYKKCYELEIVRDSKNGKPVPDPADPSLNLTKIGRAVDQPCGGGLTYYVFNPHKVQKFEFIRYKGLTNINYGLKEEDGVTPCHTMEPAIIGRDPKGNDTYFEIKLTDSSDRYFFGLNWDVSAGFKISSKKPLPSTVYKNGLKILNKYIPGKTKFIAQDIAFDDTVKAVIESEFTKFINNNMTKFNYQTGLLEKAKVTLRSSACSQIVSKSLQKILKEFSEKLK